MSDRPDTGCLRRVFRLPKEQIGYVRSVVESYEGLAQMSSLPGRCEVEWLIPRSRLEEAERLSLALAAEAGLVPIDPSDD